MKTITNTSIRNASLSAGLAIFIMAVAAAFSFGYVNGELIIPSDAQATFENLSNSLGLFAAGLLGWLIILMADVIASWGLYVSFKTVNPSLSLLMGSLRLIYTSLLGTALLNYVWVLALVSGEAYLEAIPNEQIAAQTMFFLDGFESMWSLGLIVFGGHLISLGYLLLQSLVPRLWSILILISGAAYVMIHLGDLVVPNFEQYKSIIEMIFMLPMVVGELGFGIWLVVKAWKNSLPFGER